MGQQFECTDCEFQATNKRNLVAHQKSVHVGRTLQCPDCDFQTASKESLIIHQKFVHIQRKNSIAKGVDFWQLGKKIL